MIADDIRELLERDARAATGGAYMAVEDCFEVVGHSSPFMINPSTPWMADMNAPRVFFRR